MTEYEMHIQQLHINKRSLDHGFKTFSLLFNQKSGLSLNMKNITKEERSAEILEILYHPKINRI